MAVPEGHFHRRHARGPDALLGDEAKGLSANVVSRLKSEWATEYAGWMKRDLSASRYLYWRADGIHTGVREEWPRSCLLVIIGVTAEGKKELVTIGDGLRESTASWLEVLRELKARGAGRSAAAGGGRWRAGLLGRAR